MRRLIEERNWTHPVGLDRDGALANLYRVGGCPTFVYAFPGGILQSTSIGELTDEQFAKISEHLTPEVRTVLNVRGALASRDGRGGTAPSAVAVQLAEVKDDLAAQHAWATARQ